MELKERFYDLFDGFNKEQLIGVLKECFDDYDIKCTVNGKTDYMTLYNYVLEDGVDDWTTDGLKDLMYDSFSDERDLRSFIDSFEDLGFLSCITRVVQNEK